ncbi:MAG: glycoside hydrolase family 78 protein [Puniceicoccales bacterium]|nr:glycoside hydrolase family 78 protein [Puniceicoccales bacterium]
MRSQNPVSFLKLFSVVKGAGALAAATFALAFGGGGCAPVPQSASEGESATGSGAAAARACSLAAPVRLRTEHLGGVPVVETREPLLSWALEPAGDAASAAFRNLSQGAYQVQVASAAAKFDAAGAAGAGEGCGDVFDSGRVESGEQAPVVALGDKLIPNKTYFWRVRVWDGGSGTGTGGTGGNGTGGASSLPSAWSAPAAFITAPEAGAWSLAAWLGVAENGVGKGEGHASRVAPWFRKVFRVAGDALPAEALVHVASFGYHELYVNGERVGDTVLDPAISNLALRVFSRTYDVARHLRPGRNVIGVWLGHGWSGYGDWLDTRKEGVHVRRAPHGPAFKLLAPAIGVVSDFSWRAHPSPFSKTGPWSYFNFGGESYDARREQPDWASPALNDADWQPAVPLTNVGEIAVTPQNVEPNRVTATFPAAGVERTGAKKWRVDMGRVFTGRLRLTLTGAAGDEVKIRYTDKGPDDPAVDDARHESAYGQEDRVVLSGRAGGDVFASRFNYRCFRWATVEGVATAPAAVSGELIRTDYARAAAFKSSSPLLDKIHAVVTHTYECLTLGGYIVDCAHRERLGYGAEGQASMDSGFHNFDQAAFYRKWLGDWRDVLMRDGRLTNTAPTTWGGGGPAWKLVCATLPWEHYTHIGDKRVLAENYDMLVRHLAMLEDRITKNPRKILPIFTKDKWQYIGDWYSALYFDPQEQSKYLPPAVRDINPVTEGERRGYERIGEQPPKEKRGIAYPQRQFFSNCFTILGFQTAAKIAAELGKADDIVKYTTLADNLRKAVHDTFYDPVNNTYTGVSEQSYLAVPLLINLPPPELRGKLREALFDNIAKKRGGHLTTGVLASLLQYRYLTAENRDDLVCAAMLKDDYPSIGYFFKYGLTTVPEAWDIVGSGSRCHTSFLSSAAWLVNGLAGVQPDPAAPGYKHFLLRPGAVAGVDAASVERDTVRGKIASAWRVAEKNATTGGVKCYTLDVTIPPNTTATIILPFARGTCHITESGTPFAPKPAAPAVPAVPAPQSAVPPVNGRETAAGDDASDDIRETFTLGSGTYRFTVVPVPKS